MYKANVGDRVRLKDFSAYTTRKLTPWVWLDVLDVQEYQTRVCLHEKPAVEFFVDHASIQPPLGWRDVYDVVVSKPKDAEKVLSWIRSERGLAVWASQDLSSPGSCMYTPGDKQQKPHWSMGLVEVIHDETRIKLFIMETVYKKPSRTETGWKYDKHFKEWYRSVPYVEEGAEHASGA